MLHQKSKIVNIKGSYLVLCAHGWEGQTQPPFYWRRFSQSEKRNSVAAEKSDSESEGGQKFLFPDPFPFCPPERKIKNSFQKKFELDHKNSSRRKIAILKAPAPTLFAVESWCFCFGESSSFERSSKLNEIQQPIFCIFAYGETSKFSE
jgi:hypothetical protein